MTFGEYYKWYCYGTCIISWLYNGLLVYVVHKRRYKIGFYSYFTYFSALVDVSYSLAFATAQPFWYAGPGMLGFFSIAPWNRHFTIIQITYQFWFVSFILVLFSIVSCFTYRYGLLC
ncbi:hypothetical protein PENTCL1PPCAC_15485, partial [Pristionchus entomophagus]